MTPGNSPKVRWLNSTIVGIGFASLFSDWSHEVATAVMPAFLASMGAGAAWVGLIEGVSDGLSSFAKLASGHWTDRLVRRKPILVVGYVVTAASTACFGFATAAWHILMARSVAWLGRGARSPVRKAIMAAAVPREGYGRAFGFERMMDTVGAIVGPATALLLLQAVGLGFREVFFCALIPGMVAVAFIVFAVREKGREKVPSVSFREGLRQLPTAYRRFLVAVGIFGAGDFSHTLLILFATQRLAPSLGMAGAAAAAGGLYLAHNLCYAGFAFIAGWLADRMPKPRLLAAGYGLAACMALALIALPSNLATLVLVFALGGIFVAVEETVEDSLCAEMVPCERHGMAFGVLATVNGAGDFVSSVVVGALWSAWGARVAFAYSFLLFAAGAAVALCIRTQRQ